MDPLFFAMLAASGSGAARFFRLLAVSGSENAWAINKLRYLVDGVEYPITPMTSNTTPAPLVASASSSASGNDPWLAFDDGSIGFYSYWTNSEAVPWIQIDFGPDAQVDAKAVRITADQSVFGPQNFSVVSSNDGVTWFTRLSVGAVDWATNGPTITFPFSV